MPVVVVNNYRFLQYFAQMPLGVEQSVRPIHIGAPPVLVIGRIATRTRGPAPPILLLPALVRIGPI